QILREVFNHVPVGLVRDQVRNVGLRHTGLLEEGAHSRRDVLADEVAHAASIHPEVVLPACEGRLAGRYTTSTRRDPDEVAVGPRTAESGCTYPLSVGHRSQDRRARSVTEQHNGPTVGRIEYPGVHVRPDHQGVATSRSTERALRHRQGKNETAAH